MGATHCYLPWNKAPLFEPYCPRVEMAKGYQPQCGLGLPMSDFPILAYNWCLLVTTIQIAGGCLICLKCKSIWFKSGQTGQNQGWVWLQPPCTSIVISKFIDQLMRKVHQTRIEPKNLRLMAYMCKDYKFVVQLNHSTTGPIRKVPRLLIYPISHHH